MIASLVSARFAVSFDIHPESFHVSGIPELSVASGLKMLLVAVGCGIVSILFCVALKGIGQLYSRFLKNPYLRIVAASGAVIVITLLLQSADFMGAGNGSLKKQWKKDRPGPLIFCGS